MFTNTNAWRKAVTAIYLEFLWDNASSRPAQFNMCFWKVVLQPHAEGCGRRQHLCCPVGCPSHVVELYPQAVARHGYRPGWDMDLGELRAGSETETHWGSSGVSLGEEAVNLAQSLGIQIWGPDQRSTSSRYELGICLMGKHRTSTLFFTMFLTNLMKMSSP